MIGTPLDYTTQATYPKNRIVTIFRATLIEARAEFDKAIADGASSVIVKHFSLVVMLHVEE